MPGLIAASVWMTAIEMVSVAEACCSPGTRQIEAGTGPGPRPGLRDPRPAVASLGRVRRGRRRDLDAAVEGADRRPSVTEFARPERRADRHGRVAHVELRASPRTRSGSRPFGPLQLDHRQGRSVGSVPTTVAVEHAAVRGGDADRRDPPAAPPRVTTCVFVTHVAVLAEDRRPSRLPASLTSSATAIVTTHGQRLGRDPGRLVHRARCRSP